MVLSIGQISRSLRLLAVLATMMSWPLTASAFVITQLDDYDKGTPCDGISPPSGACDLFEVSSLVTGNLFTVDWDFVSGEDVVDVTATFTVDSIVGNTLTLTVAITNNSTAPITSLGLSTGDYILLAEGSGIVAVEDEGEFFNMFATDARGFGSEFDACVFSTNCFAGSQQGGIPGGGIDTFTMALVTSDGTYDGTLDHFVIKFQGVASFQLPGTPCCSDPLLYVPEPSTLLLFGSGLLGLGVLARRRRSLTWS